MTDNLPQTGMKQVQHYQPLARNAGSKNMHFEHIWYGLCPAILFKSWRKKKAKFTGTLFQVAIGVATSSKCWFHVEGATKYRIEETFLIPKMSWFKIK